MHKDLREFVALLNSIGVKYVIVGGYAVAFHGHPRFTGDIDVFVQRSADNADRLLRVLKEFGFEQLQLKRDDFQAPNAIVQLGVVPHRIDILTGLSGVQFDQVWTTREQSTLDGLAVSYINKQLLLVNKRAAGRPQDIADIAQLDSTSLDENDRHG